jgi:hypothetical protein
VQLLKVFVGPLKGFACCLIVLVFSLLVYAAYSDSREDEILQNMEQLLESGVGKLREGLISEAMKRLVSVLAEHQKLSRSFPQASEVAQAAQIELAKLQTSLALEADPLWLDESMNQKVGSTLDAAAGPVVILTWRTETGRSLVFNAPIRFDFIEGSGTLTAEVNTDAYGQASCVVGKFDQPQREQVIRASLSIRAGDFVYPMQGVYRDFLFAPPANRATIFVLERSKQGVSEDPYILSPVFETLKKLDYDFSLYNSYLSTDEFARIYAGERESIARLALEEGISYLIVLLNDCYSVRQLEMGGRKLNLFVSEAKATTRIIRVADGKVMFQKSIERSKSNNNHGQGGSEEKAILDALRQASHEMARALDSSFAEVRKSLTGESE